MAHEHPGSNPRRPPKLPAYPTLRKLDGFLFALVTHLPGMSATALGNGNRGEVKAGVSVVEGVGLGVLGERLWL